VCADGGVVQEHTLRGLDGLASAGTVSPALAGPWPRHEGQNRSLTEGALR
jgi:hypothetical protein